MDRQAFLIGEVARRSGLSRKTLRFYEALGILPPPRRTAARYRLYSAEVLGVLAFVTQARRLGLTLADIKEIVTRRRSGSPPCGHVRRLLGEKAADLADMLRAVRRILDAWPTDRGRPAAVCPHIEAKADAVAWRRSGPPSARRVGLTAKSSSRATPSAPPRRGAPPAAVRRSGGSWSA